MVGEMLDPRSEAFADRLGAFLLERGLLDRSAVSRAKSAQAKTKERFDLVLTRLGLIQEVDDLSRAMAKLWMGEALGYKGRRVALSIMNSRVPITGTLVDVTPEGLLIDQDGKQVAVSFSRLSGIDAA